MSAVAERTVAQEQKRVGDGGGEGRKNYTDAVPAVEKSLFFDEIYKILTFPTNRNEKDDGVWWCVVRKRVRLSPKKEYTSSGNDEET